MHELREEAEKRLASKPDKRKRFRSMQRFKSKAWRAAGKVGRKLLFYTLFTSAVAIGGANLGTYFSYKYHNHEYKSMPNKTRIALQGEVDNDSIINAALNAAKIRVVGTKAPEEAKLNILIVKNGEETTLETSYTMVWNTNKGVKKRDEEIMIIRWKLDSKEKKFVPYEAQTRYHYKTVKFPLSGRVPAIVIQNPAHTPGIPGTQARYQEPIKIVDVFTLFSAEKWAGSSLACGAPHEFKAMNVTFRTGVNVLNKTEASDRIQNN
jgi:hypothetical protein